MKVVARLIDLIVALCIQEYCQFLYRQQSSAQRDAVGENLQRRAERSDGRVPWLEP